jgi:Ser/Thr protein kinase RdoA (MazF antagonist)
MVADCDGVIDAETIRSYLIAFQSVTPLNIGELWAVPLMLRMRLVESLRSLAIQVEQLQRESEEADFWANRLITAAEAQSGAVGGTDGGIGPASSGAGPHFASELVAHLYNEEAALPMVTEWLDAPSGRR